MALFEVLKIQPIAFSPWSKFFLINDVHVCVYPQANELTVSVDIEQKWHKLVIGANGENMRELRDRSVLPTTP